VDEFNVPFGQFSFQAVQLLFEPDQLLLAGGENFFLQRLPLNGPQSADLFMLLAIPIDQGALTDFEPLGNAAQAPTLGSEFEELIFGVGVIHNGALFRQSVIRAPQARKRD
jgi:hypothetical protein